MCALHIRQIRPAYIRMCVQPMSTRMICVVEADKAGTPGLTSFRGFSFFFSRSLVTEPWQEAGQMGSRDSGLSTSVSKELQSCPVQQKQQQQQQQAPFKPPSREQEQGSNSAPAVFYLDYPIQVTPSRHTTQGPDWDPRHAL